MKEATELYCHGCDGYVRVELDYSLNGNHRIECPKCGHSHYRVIEDGKITLDRYQPKFITYNYSTSMTNYNTSSCTDTCSSSDNQFLTDSWYQTTGNSVYY